MTPTSDQEARRERLVERLEGRAAYFEYMHTVKETGGMTPDACREHAEDLRSIIALLAPVGLGEQEVSLAQERGEAGAATLGEANSGGSSPRACWKCSRCGRDEIDCRANGCTRGPCPMEPV